MLARSKYLRIPFLLAMAVVLSGLDMIAQVQERSMTIEDLPSLRENRLSFGLSTDGYFAAYTEVNREGISEVWLTDLKRGGELFLPFSYQKGQTYPLVVAQYPGSSGRGKPQSIASIGTNDALYAFGANRSLQIMLRLRF